jgi:uncharacterized protein DUF2834
MVSLIVHALLGVFVVILIVRLNPRIFRRVPNEPLFSPIELAIYAIGIASVIGGWSFNIAFVREYGHGIISNPVWGDGSWAQYIKLMFANPAAGSAGIDYTIANVVVLPVVVVVWGRRLGINKPWLYFVATLFASFAFGWAFFAATAERQRRLQLQGVKDVQTV